MALPKGNSGARDPHHAGRGDLTCLDSDACCGCGRVKQNNFTLYSFRADLSCYPNADFQLCHLCTFKDFSTESKVCSHPAGVEPLKKSPSCGNPA